MTSDLIRTGTLDTVRRLNAPASAKVLFALATRIDQGSVSIRLPDGLTIRFGGKRPGLDAVMRVHDYAFARRFLTGGSVGFAESYMDGEWDTPDLASLLEVAARNTAFLSRAWSGNPLLRTARRIGHLFNANTKRQARKNITAHYDLGNAFYARWLDGTMTYSAARFDPQIDDLSAAQRNKYRALAEKIGLRSGHRVLEIGCGWGGFAEFAAGEVGAQVVGLTISKEQQAFASRRMAEKGLSGRVEIRLQDYRDVQGSFDRVASIEMFEAVGESYWPVYFDTVRERLRPGGVAGLQIITVRDEDFETYRRNVDFIQRYIFPGGMLPSPSRLRAIVAARGLNWVEENAFGLDYARTLRVWHDRFLAAWDDIRTLGFDERFKRMWRYYLSYCEAGFRCGNIDVAQIALVRP